MNSTSTQSGGRNDNPSAHWATKYSWFCGLALIAAGLGPAGNLDAAAVSWDPPFVIDETADVSNQGSVHVAADFNTADGFGPDGGVINGIPFTQTGPAGIEGKLVHSFSSGPNNGAAAYAAVAPAGMDPDLVELLDSHSWHPGNPATAMVTLEGLTVGQLYQIQVLGAVDTRTCCAGRIYEPDDGAGNFTTGVSIQRGLIQSLIGTFTADAATQVFQWQSAGGAMGNNDPAMSGLVVLAVPEPGCLFLAATAAALYSIMSVRRRSI